MKTLCALLFTVLFLIVAIISCETSEPEYPCDPSVNKFVKKNRTELSHITINKLNTYNISLQRAIFNSWDPGKKRDAWIAKLNFVIADERFNEDELNHIQKLLDHITEDYFTKDNIEDSIQIRSAFAEDWINYAKIELGFSDQFIAFLVYRLYLTQQQLESEPHTINYIGKLPAADGEYGDCDCNSSADFCNPFDCNSGNCNITSGCGWLWSMPCDGNCY